MTQVWLVLYLGTLVHVAALYRLRMERGAWLVLLPFFVLPAIPPLAAKLGGGRTRALRWAAGAIAFGSSVALARRGSLGFPDLRDAATSGLFAAAGIASAWVASAGGPTGGAAPWVWCAAWLLIGAIDPVMSLVGAGLAALLAASGIHLGSDEPLRAGDVPPWAWAFSLGLVLPKPWWDFGFDPDWAPVLACWSLGAAVGASMTGLRLSGRWAAIAIGFQTALLFGYPPAFPWPWSLTLGIVTGLGFLSLRRRSFLALTYGLLFGLVVSFFLHSVLLLPWLRSLLWWGGR